MGVLDGFKLAGSSLSNPIPPYIAQRQWGRFAKERREKPPEEREREREREAREGGRERRRRDG
jgi:hypothetical protein